MKIKEPEITNINIELTKDEFHLLCYAIFNKIDEYDFTHEKIDYDLKGKRRRFTKDSIRNIKASLESYFRIYEKVL